MAVSLEIASQKVLESSMGTLFIQDTLYNVYAILGRRLSLVSSSVCNFGHVRLNAIQGHNILVRRQGQRDGIVGRNRI